FYVTSFSSRTLVYAGMLISRQIQGFFPDVCDPEFESALCLVHSRYSTNTLGSWNLAHPFRYLAHNGEINTIEGNQNWMRAREGTMSSGLFGADLAKLYPIMRAGSSGSARLDHALEFLVLPGRGPGRTSAGVRPPAWEDRSDGHGCRPARLLRIPLGPDGAVGRSRFARVHRRPQDRRRARPQRPAALALRGDEGWLRRDGVGSGRSRDRPRERGREGAAASR